MTYESDIKNCRFGETPFTQLKGQDGKLYTIAPGSGYEQAWGYYSNWKTVNDGTSGSGGYWRGLVEGTEPRIGNQETYGYCVA